MPPTLSEELSRLGGVQFHGVGGQSHRHGRPILVGGDLEDVVVAKVGLDCRAEGEGGDGGRGEWGRLGLR